MKKPLLFALTAALATNASASLVITSVFDGPLTGGTPKGVELYVTDDIPDLSEYGLGSANNGGGSDGVEFTFPAISAQAGDYIYLATDTEGFTQFFGFAPTYVTNAVSVNGDDAIEVFHLNSRIDVFGQIDTDGTGTAWDYQDGWAHRTNTTASNSFNSSDWSFSGPNAWDNETQNATAAAKLPLATPSDGGNPDEPPAPALQLISSIQGEPATQGSNVYGETDVSPLIGTSVTVEAIVVGDFQNNDADTSRDLGGFFLQEETSDEDGNSATSEGLFVFDPDTTTDVALGDRVRVIGEVDQYYGETQLANIQSITVLAHDQLSQVTSAQVSLLDNQAITQNQNMRYQPDLEAYEGMLVTLVDEVQITEQFQLDRFNEIRVSAGPRPVQFTQQNTPDAELYPLWQQDIGRRTLIYDDGLNVQNASIDNLPGFAPYTEATASRMGDTAAHLTGVLDYKWSGNSTSGATWRLRAHQDNLNQFSSTIKGDSPNPRPAAAPVVGGNLKITSFNVLNFFSSIDTKGALTAAGHDPRGADTEEEFARQLQKTVNAIVMLNADVLGLIELENEFDPINDGNTAIETLVNAINARLGSDVYRYVYPGQRFVGSDAIAVGIIYKPAVVTPAENTHPALLDDDVARTLPTFASRDFNSDPIFNGDATNRVSLAVSFEHLATGDVFTVAVNHFKSKGASDLTDTASPNYDQLDGAGYWNQRRLDAAQAVVEWLSQAPTGVADDDIALLGDFNAYAQEAPVQYLLAQGFNNVESGDDYSFVFDGQQGTLDYLLISDALQQKLVHSAVWHINSDEADALDYNLDFGRRADYFDASTPTRSSDHDPVIVGLELVPTIKSIADLLNIFEQAVTAGEVVGNSRFPFVADIYTRTFAKLLARAQKNMQADRTVSACLLLKVSSGFSDGDAKPRDLIRGEGVATLNSGIEQLLSEHCTAERFHQGQ